MAKSQVIEDRQLEHLLRATAAYSRMPERAQALLLTLYGTALAVTELASITVADYLNADGSVRVESELRAEISHNGEARPLFWSNKRVMTALDAYLAWRLIHRHGVTNRKGAYRGLNPSEPIFLTEVGEAYRLTQRILPSGALSYSCNSLSTYIVRLHANAGIEGGSAQAARRSFAVKQHRQGRDLVHIATLLGHKSLATTRRLIEGDPVRLAEIVARAI